MTIYCFIYDGIASWRESDVAVTVKVPNQPEIVVEMGRQIDSRSFCAIAEIEFDEYKQMSMRKAVTFHNGHEDCDRHYGWAIQLHHKFNIKKK